MAHHLTLTGSYSEIDRDEWNGLLGHSSSACPMLRWEFLSGLEETGCTRADTGWQPIPLTVRDDHGALLGAAPLYLKDHSYGEYVFDWAWADAYERAGFDYFPKLLVAIPFSPIPGARLLTQSPKARSTLIEALQSQVQSAGLSSAHILFPDELDLSELKASGWLIREGVQFHWRNLGFQAFEDYLSSLTQPKRKKVKAERRKVRDAGVTTRVLSGEEITPEVWEFFYACYARTYREHRSTPYLNLEFFLHLAKTMPQALVLCLADRQHHPIAASLLLRSGEVLYGRYWGAVERVDSLHFELAYYTPIEWAIGQGIQRFEGGAQGEHKLARGFTPVKTYSAHWLAQPQFKDAVARFLERESAGIEAYVNELEDRSPIRRLEFR
jgi:uncharacterized protein